MLLVVQNNRRMELICVIAERRVARTPRPRNPGTESQHPETLEPNPNTLKP